MAVLLFGKLQSKVLLAADSDVVHKDNTGHHRKNYKVGENIALMQQKLGCHKE